MIIEFEVFKCGQFDGMLYTKEEVLEKVEKWIDEEEIEEDGKDDSPTPIYNVLNTIKIKKIGEEK